MSQHVEPISIRRKKRNDIQGLRAVGALLVAVFHIWIGGVSGGVDVFFVVSGYLLIGSLGRRVHREGAFSLRDFLSRLVRRLLPASYTVIFVVLLFGILILPQGTWVFLIKNVAASAVYLENWLLAVSSVDYLARDEIPGPLLHYWAMAVQVQCLVLWALLLWLFASMSGRRRWGRATIVAAIFFVSALSLAYSAYATEVNQPRAYYDSFARMWEFGLGALTALAIKRPEAIPAVMRAAGSWLGLALMLSCGFVLDAGSLFPGYAALWPTTGAALLLICGKAGDPYNAGGLLAMKPLVWLGGISYGLYLWHWPLIIVYRTVFYESSIGIVPGVGILGASVVLAWWTTYLVEQRVQSLPEAHFSRSIFASLAALFLLAAIDGAWAAYTRWTMPTGELMPNGVCPEWNQNVMAELARLKPDLVVTIATHGRAMAAEQVYPDFLDQWQAVAEMGSKVIAIRDNPWHYYDVPQCVEINGPRDERCNLHRDRVLAPSPFSNIAPPQGVYLVDFTNLFCPGRSCPAVIGNVLVYRDKHHVTASYIRTMVPALREKLWPLLSGVES